MGKLQMVDIIENPFQVVDWYAQNTDKGIEVISDIREYQGHNELEDYRNSGVYHMAQVPFSIYRVSPITENGVTPFQAMTESYSDCVCKSILNGHCHLVVGSYCSMIPPVLGGIQRAVGQDKEIGIVWMDAHADNQSVEGRENARVPLVAVPTAVFTGRTMECWRKKTGLITPIKDENILAGDIRSVSPESAINLKNCKWNIVKQRDFQNTKYWKSQVQKLAEKVDMIFLHIDADILDLEYIPAYDYELSKGNSIEVVTENIKAVMETQKVIGASVMCFAFENQPLRKQDVNTMNGIRIISSILRNWKACIAIS